MSKIILKVKGEQKIIIIVIIMVVKEGGTEVVINQEKINYQEKKNVKIILKKNKFKY